MAAKDLITLARAYQALQGVSNQDALLGTLITAYSEAVAKWRRRRFVSTAFDELYNGNGDRRLLLRQYPLHTELHSILLMSSQASLVSGAMRRIPFTRHLTESETRRAYRACRHAVEKVRWHAVWLLARTDCPRSPAEVAQVAGLSDVAVRGLLRRWNLLGPEGLADRRSGNGRAARLSARRWGALARALTRRPADGGLWTGPKAAPHVLDRWGVRVRPETGWRWLRRLGLTLQVPRPAHPRSAARADRRRWKKTCAGGWPG
jgi:transposase